MQNITVKEAGEKAMQCCSRREYCQKEMLDRIISWGCTSAEAREVVDSLVKEEFVDDRRYTEAYVKDKLRFNKWGRVKVSYMLRTQNIDKAIVTDVLSAIDEAEYNQMLIVELQKKRKTLRGSAFDIKGKLFRFAVGRGFEPDVINAAISEIEI
jgi:regulatory protein